MNALFFFKIYFFPGFWKYFFFLEKTVEESGRRYTRIHKETHTEPREIVALCSAHLEYLSSDQTTEASVIAPL